MPTGLQPQVMPVVFQGGLAQKIDPKLAVPGKFLTLQDIVRNKEGVFNKRFGFDELPTAISGGGDITGALALGVFNDDFVTFTDSKAYSWSPGARHWFEKGDITAVTATTTQTLRNSYQQTSVDSATNQGVRVVAYTDSRGGVWAVVLDDKTGSPLLAETQLNSGAIKPTAVKCGQYLYVFYVNGSNLYGRRINSLNPAAFESEISIATDAVNDITLNQYDAIEFGNFILLAYNSTAPGIIVTYVTQALAVGGPSYGTPSPTTLAEVGSRCLTLNYNTNSIFVAYNNASQHTRVEVLLHDLSVSHAPQTLDSDTVAYDNITGSVNGSSVVYFYERHHATPMFHRLKKASVSFSGTVTAGAVLVRSVGLTSKAFTYQGRVYANACYQSALQSTFFLIRDDGFVAAKVNPGNAGGIVTTAHLPQIVPDSSNAALFHMSILTRSPLISSNGTTYSITGIARVDLDFAADSTYQTAQLGGNLHLATGVLQAYDGFSVVEHGFHLYPEPLTPVVVPGGSVDIGTGSYKVVYAWYDNQGQIHRSAPSVAVFATTTSGNQTVEIEIPTLRLTQKKGTRSNVFIEVYRTLFPNGTTYFLISDPHSPLYNDLTTDTVIYTDTAASSTIGGNEILYTDGGIVDNNAPQSCKLIVAWKDRLVVSGMEDPNTFWFSEQWGPSFGVAFSGQFVGRVDGQGGDVTALGVLDDKLIFFKRTALLYMSGNGPNNAGTQNDYGNPVQIPTDAGCDNPNSVIAIPGGIIYHSPKGIYLLDSSLIPHYIGGDVEDFNNLTIESAIIMDKRQEVRFTTKEGPTLVFNYFFKEWYTHTNLTAFDAIQWRGQYAVLKADGKVWTENSGANGSTVGYRDAGQPILPKLKTTWLSFAGLQAFQRVWRFLFLGEYKSPSTLRVSMAYDFEQFFTDDKYFNTETGLGISANTYGTQSPYGTGNYGGGALTPGSMAFQFRGHLTRQKCQAVQFQLEEIAVGTTDESMALTGFSFEVGAKKGAYKLPVAKTV